MTDRHEPHATIRALLEERDNLRKILTELLADAEWLNREWNRERAEAGWGDPWDNDDDGPESFTKARNALSSSGG